MEGGEEAAGNRWTQGARHGGRRGGSRKPLDAGGKAWREERRQQETAGRRERGMEGGEEAAGKPLSAGGEAWREERGGSGETAGCCGGERRAGAVSQSWGWTATWLSMNK